MKLSKILLEAQRGTPYFKNIDAHGFTPQDAMVRFLDDNKTRSPPAKSTGPMIPRVLYQQPSHMIYWIGPRYFMMCSMSGSRNVPSRFLLFASVRRIWFYLQALRTSL